MWAFRLVLPCRIIFVCNISLALGIQGSRFILDWYKFLFFLMVLPYQWTSFTLKSLLLLSILQIPLVTRGRKTFFPPEKSALPINFSQSKSAPQYREWAVSEPVHLNVNELCLTRLTPCHFLAGDVVFAGVWSQHTIGCFFFKGSMTMAGCHRPTIHIWTKTWQWRRGSPSQICSDSVAAATRFIYLFFPRPLIFITCFSVYRLANTSSLYLKDRAKAASTTAGEVANTEIHLFSTQWSNSEGKQENWRNLNQWATHIMGENEFGWDVAL